jgi:acetyl esterase/lipase
LQFDYAKGFPKDTSYSLTCAYNKIIKNYPYAEFVESDTYNNYELFKDIVYSSNGIRELCLDIYTSKENLPGLKPCVLLIHGSGWSSDSPVLLVNFAKDFSSGGIVSVLVEYTLSPGKENTCRAFTIL